MATLIKVYTTHTGAKILVIFHDVDDFSVYYTDTDTSVRGTRADIIAELINANVWEGVRA